MKNISKTTLTVYYSDQKTVHYGLASSRAVCDGFDLILHTDNGIFSPELIVTADERTRGISCIIIRYSLTRDFADDDLLYYTDAHTTNDQTDVRSFGDCAEASANCLVTAKNTRSGDCIGIGRVTGFRFFSYVGIDRDSVYIQYQMEDKPLISGKEYRLEKYILGDEETESFLAHYARTVSILCGAKPADAIPLGFCSWSRYFSDVDEEKIRRASDMLVHFCGEKADLVQIDDGWQRSGSFPGIWEENRDRFPGGIAETAAHVHANGQKFGLWLAPFLVNEKSEYFDSIRDIVRTDVCTLPGVHPLDLDKAETYDHFKKTFRKMIDDYHAEYFKLDFLLAGYKFFTESPHPEVRFESDYAVALFRKALLCIRECVGDDVMLLSCGAPIIECAGIVNLQRASCDIIWGKSDPNFPLFWSIMKGASSTIIRRYFYNNTVFLNDPDGIVVRDIDVGDGFDCSYSEAKFWVASAFVSGGSWLHNEELENLSEGRRQFYLNCIPYLGATGKPLDFYEKPLHTVISRDENHTYLTYFNPGDTYADFRFELSRIGLGRCHIEKMLDRTDLGISDVIEEKMINPHSAEIYILSAI